MQILRFVLRFAPEKRVLGMKLKKIRKIRAKARQNMQKQSA